MKSAHDLDIKGFKRMSGRLNEVDARMHAIIYNIHAIDLVLGIKIGVEACLNVLNDRSPRVVIVDKITEARRIHNCKT